MAASIPLTVNDKIKKKLLALNENVRRNLLLASSDVQRKFILEERDLLSILVLAIQYLQKPPQPTSSLSSTSPTPPTTTEEKQQQQQHQTTPTTTTTTDTTTTATMGKSGGNNNNPNDSLDTSEKLRRELLKILDSTSFDSDAKSWLLLDAYNRYNNYTTLNKEREIIDRHLKTHPNVMVGGGKSFANESNEEINGCTDNNSDKSESPTTRTTKTTDSKTTTPPSSETTPKNDRIVTNEKQGDSPVHIWINDALKTITSYMKNKVNVIFLENLQSHACRLQNFLSSKCTFDKDNNRIIAPNNRFFLKKGSLYFKIKAVKGLQNFDLATLLACVSFSKSKLFRFLQYRFKKVRAFSKNEKQCIHIFLNACPISKKRIPCSSIRDLAKT